jgi:hypothetical protein
MHRQISLTIMTVALIGLLAGPSSSDPLQPRRVASQESAPVPLVTVLGSKQAEGILGKEVRSSADENMGRIVDIIVDRSGQVRAAVIDFGGFLGVGSRKIAVDWKALRFPIAEDRKRVVLEMSREQVRAAPEYQEGKPIFVLSAAGRGPVLVTTGSAGR